MAIPNRFLLGAVLGVALATVVLTATVLFALRLDRRDRINARAACHRAGGEVVLNAEGEWRCECGEGK